MSLPTTIPNRETWSITAETYSSNVGRTSSLAATRLLTLVQEALPITSTSHVLDNGAGTGAVTFAVASQLPSTHVLATDLTPAMLSNISSANFPNVSVRALDARSLSQELPSDSFTHAFSTFMLHTITTPVEALHEMHSVMRSNGIVGIAIWAQRNGPFDIWERACRSLDSGYALPEPFDDPHAWRTCQELENALGQVGFREIKTEEICMPFPFESTESFLEFWFGAKNPAAEKYLSNWQGNKETIKRAMERICREEFGDGKNICTWAVLGTGRKS